MPPKRRGRGRGRGRSQAVKEVVDKALGGITGESSPHESLESFIADAKEKVEEEQPIIPAEEDNTDKLSEKEGELKTSAEEGKSDTPVTTAEESLETSDLPGCEKIENDVLSVNETGEVLPALDDMSEEMKANSETVGEIESQCDGGNVQTTEVAPVESDSVIDCDIVDTEEEIVKISDTDTDLGNISEEREPVSDTVDSVKDAEESEVKGKSSNFDFMEVVEEICEDISQGDEIELNEAEDIKESDDDEEEVQYIDEEIVDEEMKESVSNKFEEISDGSINEDVQMEPAKEDVTLEEAGKNAPVDSAKKEVKQQKRKSQRGEAESLEAVFFATENDTDVVIVEDKDNDIISDDSLSDHNDLSLEEISDDELDESKVKKRRKSLLQTPEKKSELENGSKELKSKKVEELKGVTAGDLNKTGDGDKNKKAVSEEKSTSATATKTPGDDEPAFFTGACGAKPIDPAPPAKKIKKRSKSPRNKSRSISNEKTKKQFADFNCQTDKIHMKGKIVQCSINPVSAGKSSGTSADGEAAVSLEYQRFKAKIPTSISAQMFSAVNAAALPEKGFSYAVSLGPVTLSDMDNTDFREVTLKSMKRFSLIFDAQNQGVLTGSMSTHQDTVRLMRNLKQAQLGNRYMVVTVTLMNGPVHTGKWWSGTVVLMYEQDLLKAKQLVSWDGKIRSKLIITGVPPHVTKDFVHLFFPEALGITSATTIGEGRAMSIGFSNKILMDEVCNCYDLLVMNGCQISLKGGDNVDMAAAASQPGGYEEQSGVVVIQEDITETEEVVVPSTSWGGPAVTMEPMVTAESQEDKDVDMEAVGEDGKSDKQTADESSKCRGDSQPSQPLKSILKSSKKLDGTWKVPVTEEVNEKSEALNTTLVGGDVLKSGEKADVDQEDSSVPADVEKSEDKSLEEAVTSQSSNETETTKVAASDDVSTDAVGASENSQLDSLEVSKAPEAGDAEQSENNAGVPLIEQKGTSDLVGDICAEKEVLSTSGTVADDSEETGEPETGGENLDEIEKDVAATVNVKDDTSDKTSVSKKDENDVEKTDEIQVANEDVNKNNEDSVTEALVKDDSVDDTNKEISEDKDDDVSKTDIATEEKTTDKDDPASDCKKDNLEDVSDEEMPATQGDSDTDDVVILKEEEHKKVLAEIDLTAEETEVEKKASDCDTPKTDTTAAVTAKVDAKVEKTSEQVDKLVMVDGQLEVEMEVEDVDEGEESSQTATGTRVLEPSDLAWAARSRHAPPTAPTQKISSLKPSSRAVVPSREQTSARRTAYRRSPPPRARDDRYTRNNYNPEFDARRYTSTPIAPTQLHNSNPSGRGYNGPGGPVAPLDWNRGTNINSWPPRHDSSYEPPYNAYNRDARPTQRPADWRKENTYSRDDYRRGGYLSPPRHSPSRYRDEPYLEYRGSRIEDNREPPSFGGYSKSYSRKRTNRSRSYSSLSSDSNLKSDRRRRTTSKRVSHSPITLSSRSRSLTSVSRSPSPMRKRRRSNHSRSREPLSSHGSKKYAPRARSPDTPPRRVRDSVEDHYKRRERWEKRGKERESRRSPGPEDYGNKRKIFQTRSPVRRSRSPIALAAVRSLGDVVRSSKKSSGQEVAMSQLAGASNSAQKWDSYKGNTSQTMQYTVPPPNVSGGGGGGPPHGGYYHQVTTVSQTSYQAQAPGGAPYMGVPVYNPQYGAQNFPNPYAALQSAMASTQQYYPPAQQPSQSHGREKRGGGSVIQVPLNSQTSSHTQSRHAIPAIEMKQESPPSRTGRDSKKNWSMGTNAMMFQRILGSDGRKH